MQRNLFSYIWRFSRPEQIVILLYVVLAQVFYFLSLSVPKAIVNNGIQGIAFKDKPTERIFSIEIPLPDFLGGTIHLFHGFTVDQTEYLVAMSFAFLAAVIVNAQFRRTINTQKGRMGERMLRRLRQLRTRLDRIAALPAGAFRRKVKQARARNHDQGRGRAARRDSTSATPSCTARCSWAARHFDGDHLHLLMQNWLLGLIVEGALLGGADGHHPAPAQAGGADPGASSARSPPASSPAASPRPPTASPRSTSMAPPTTSAPDVSELAWAGSSRSSFDLYQKKFGSPSSGTTSLSQATPFAIYLLGELSRHHRSQHECRRRRGRLAGLQGPALADQGADRLGPVAPGSSRSSTSR